MPRFQSKNGRRIRHSKVIPQVSNQSIPSSSNINSKPNLDNVNIII